MYLLDQEIMAYKRAAYAESTKRTYKTHRDTYLRFCLYFGLRPVPAETLTICRYAVFLSRTLKPSSIACYLNIIRIMHEESGLPNPMENNWFLDMVKRGIHRLHGTPPVQKLPITLDILKDIFHRLDMRLLSMYCSFCHICLKVDFVKQVCKSS